MSVSAGHTQPLRSRSAQASGVATVTPLLVLPWDVSNSNGGIRLPLPKLVLDEDSGVGTGVLQVALYEKSYKVSDMASCTLTSIATASDIFDGAL